MTSTKIKCEQNTAEWLEVRRGRITASRICDVMAILTRVSKNGKAGDAAAARTRGGKVYPVKAGGR